MIRTTRPTLIGVDVDGVLSDFCLHYARLYASITGTEVLPKAARESSYSVRETFPNAPILYHTEGFCRDMPVIEGALETFSWLLKNYEVVIISSTPSRHVHDRVEWLQALWPELQSDRIILTDRKYLVNVDVMIDDCPDQLLDFGPTRSLVFGHPYNEEFQSPGWNRVESMSELRVWVSQNCTAK